MMIGYFILLQVFVTIVQARPNDIGEEILSELEQNDANLNNGFDIEAYRRDQLKLHNYYRAKHGVPAMTMSQTLTNQAQEYAERLAAINNGLHHCNPPNCDRHGAGENLAAGGGSTEAEVDATKAWYQEVWDYNYCHNEVNFNRPGHEGKATGHFTQVIWQTSTELGIGYARTSDKMRVFVVARYIEHGNVGQLYGANVPKAQYLFDTFQNNCDGTNGGFSGWSAPGKCSRTCGGGVKFQTRTCTSPKPSLNGRDCDEDTQRLASLEWCNLEKCQAGLNHREQQCEARGYTAKAHNFGGTNECVLHCFRSGNIYTAIGDVDDGTHCNSDSGVCISGKCTDMPDYVAPTTNAAAGSITGSYTGTPSSYIWNNDIFDVPQGATNVVITNNDYNAITIKIGYKTTSGRLGITWAEYSWMNSGYTETKTVAGVSFDYKRTSQKSTVTIAGPVQPTAGYTLVLYVEGNSQADISWTYGGDAPPTNAAGSITGSYTGTPSSYIWDNDIFDVPQGATNVVITNNDYNGVILKIGYKTTSGRLGITWAEYSWMNSGYTETKTVAGVSFDYKRTPQKSTVTISGPVQPTAGYTLVLYVEGDSQADISWTYNS